MTVTGSIQTIRKELPDHVRLVAVSKYQSLDKLREAYATGQRLFGENHVQELQEKVPQMPADTEWHFIGHLQTNKVKYIAPYVALIHSVDTEKLLAEINRQASRCQRVIPVLLQIHIAREETKFGFSLEECRELLARPLAGLYPNVQFAGLMCMASHTGDQIQIAGEFRQVHDLFTEVRTKQQDKYPHFRELSMGMSEDYPIAIQEGATLVRIGSKIFGERDYGTH